MDRRYERDSVEFGRALAFSDGLFAIAMTLLVVAIAVPHITDTHSVHDLADGLNDLTPVFVSFFTFPTALLGEYFENPLSIAIYAANVGVVSGMEVVLFRHAAFRSALLPTAGSRMVPTSCYSARQGWDRRSCHVCAAGYRQSR